MKANKIATEHTLYWLAFLLALWMRLYQLGATPLSEVEAGWALQADHLIHGGSTVLGAQPAYIILTSLLFFIFGDSNFLARLFPALAGGLLVWLPFLFWQREVSAWLRRAGLVMAFGMAIDPGLVSLSRQIGSPMTALVFTLLAFACLFNRRMVWVGIFSGLALLSGPAFLQGMLILGLSWMVYKLIEKRFFLSTPDASDESPRESFSPKSIQAALYSFIATLLVAGTLFLRFPQGLAALANTIPAYLDTWIHPSGIPVLRLPASLLIYQTLVLIFGFISVARIWLGTWDDQRIRQAAIGWCTWMLVALLLPLLYAGRQVGDMAWVLIPLWALASIEISRSVLPDSEVTSSVVAAGVGAFIFIMVVVGWINLLSIVRFQANVAYYWAIIIGALLLSFISILLVAATWSTSAARLGLVWATCVVLGLQLFSNAWGMSVVRQNGAQELWPVPATAGQADLFTQTLSDLSKWNTGLKDQLEVVVLVDSYALQWELRDYPNARFQSALTPSESPPVVITDKETELPSLTRSYRGQDFNWRVYPGWEGILPQSFINWLAFRKAPLRQEQIILWARADMFPGGSISSVESEAP